MVAPGTDTSAVFTGGESYEVFEFIDVDENDISTIGDYMTDPIKTVVVDGDTILDLVYPKDFTELLVPWP